MANPTNPNRQQYQQRNQQQGRQQRPQTARQRVRDGFDDEWVGKDVEGRVVEGANVVTLRGRVIDVSKYWIKLFVNNQILYLNKAYILSIKPAEVKDGQGGPNAGGQSARQ